MKAAADATKQNLFVQDGSPNDRQPFPLFSITAVVSSV